MQLSSLKKTGGVSEVFDKIFPETGLSALMHAAKVGNESAVRVLLVAGASVNKTDPNGLNALDFAARNGHMKVVRILLENGGSLDQLSPKTGLSPLMFAATMGQELAVRLLLEEGASVNKTALNGMNALDCAAKNGHEGVMRILLEKGAIPSDSHTFIVSPELRKILDNNILTSQQRVIAEPLSLRSKAFSDLQHSAGDKDFADKFRQLQVLDDFTKVLLTAVNNYIPHGHNRKKRQAAIDLVKQKINESYEQVFRNPGVVEGLRKNIRDIILDIKMHQQYNSVVAKLTLGLFSDLSKESKLADNLDQALDKALEDYHAAEDNWAASVEDKSRNKF